MNKLKQVILTIFMLIALTLPSTIKVEAESDLGISIKDNIVTFKVKSDSESMYLIGSMMNWDTNQQIAMQKNSAGIFETSIKLDGGIYEYKYKPNKDNWDNSFIDPNNDKQNNGNSLFYMPGIKMDVADEIAMDKEYTINTTLYDDKGNNQSVNADISTTSKGVTINGNKIKVTKAFSGDFLTLTAKYKDYSTTKTIKVIKQTYKYIINYYRYDQNYNNWNLWLWETGGNGNTYEFNKGLTSDKYMQAEYEFNKPEMNFIVKKGNWESKDVSEDRTIKVQKGNTVEVWLIQGDSKVYYNKDEIDLSPKILSALAEADKKIIVNTINKIDSNKVNDFKLLDKTTNKESKLTGNLLAANKIELTTSDSINPTHEYEILSPMYKNKKVVMRNILNDDKYYYDKDDLGLTFNKGTNFKVWAPTAKKVNLLIYDDAGQYNTAGLVTNNKDYANKYEMIKTDKGVWSYNTKTNLENKYYMYEVIQPDGTSKISVDPYVKSVSANGQRGFIVNYTKSRKASTNKPKSLKPTDHIIYEMHVKDFTNSSSSGVTNPGTFKGMSEENTTLANDKSIKTGIDHLKELGVTTVHILPSFDYASVNELGDKGQFNWGYDPQNYNAIEGSYSTNPNDPIVRMNEFKEMIDTYHQNGIRVVMDVVYNHTAGIKDKSVFDNIVPGYFYRSDDNGNYTNGSGCGNEVASERKMVRKYIKDSVKYLAKEYGVDGFRFDLMGLIDTQTMQEITNELHNEVNPDILIYGEPWQAGGSVLPISQQTLKGSQKDKGFAVFNDNLRGAIKGDSDGSQGAFATGNVGNGVEDKIITGVRGSVDDFTNRASESINYVTAHDNLNLWDKVVSANNMQKEAGFLSLQDGKLVGDDAKYGSVEEAVKKKATPYKMIKETNVLDNKLVRQSLLANGIVLTSQGIPFFQAGDEMLRSKYGDHNSYKSPAAINNIDWNNKQKFKGVFNYYQGLIKLRKEHAAFRMDSKAMINANFELIHQENGLIAYKLKNHANGDSYKDIYVIYNGNDSNKMVNLKTDDPLNSIVDEHHAGTTVIKTYGNGNKVDVAAYSMKVLYASDKVDKTKLQALYDKVKDTDLSKYTSDSSKAFKDQLVAAEKVLSNNKATQANVDQAITALENAYKGLVEKNKDNKVDKTKLQVLYEKLKDIKLYQYTKDTIKKFETALNTAEQILKDNKATQKMVDKALDDLNQAYKDLKIKDHNATIKHLSINLKDHAETSQNKTNNEWKVIKTTIDNHPVKTGDQNNNALYLILCGGALVVLAYGIFKNVKQKRK